MRLLIPFAVLLFFGCAPVFKQKPSSTVHRVFDTQIVVEDTLQIALRFESRAQRRSFVDSLHNLLGREGLSYSSSTDKSKVKIVVDSSGTEKTAFEMTPVDTAGFSEKTIVKDSQESDSALSAAIDKLSLATFQPFMHYRLERLLALADCQQLPPTITTSGGLIIDSIPTASSIDAVEQIRNYFLSQPAQAAAIWSDLQGITTFLQGAETLPRGLRASAPQQITFRSTSNLKQAFCLDAHLQALLGLGQYRLVSKRNNLRYLISSTPAATPVDSLKITLRNANDPLLDFSLKKHDCVMSSARADLEFVQKGQNAVIQNIAEDRYFLVTPIGDLGIWLAQKIDKNALGSRVLKVLGRPIAHMHEGITDGSHAIENKDVAAYAFMDMTMRVIHRKKDRLAKQIAEKIYATMQHDAMQVSTLALSDQEFEKRLLSAEYECAIDFVSRDFLQKPGASEVVSKMYFQGQNDIGARVQRGVELGLFAVQHFLACHQQPQAAALQQLLHGASSGEKKTSFFDLW